jgi:drug/metabolite transporter (DMT)-like permease
VKKLNVKKTILVLIACLLWGSAFPVLKLTYSELNLAAEDIGVKLILAGARFLLASIFILTYYKLKSNKILISSIKEGFNIMLLGIFQTTILYIFFYNGLANTSGVKSSVLSQTSIFFVAIIAHFTFKDDKFTNNKLIGLILGVVGIVILNINVTNSDILNFKFMGEGFLLIAGLSGAIGTILAKKLTYKYNPIKVTGLQMLFGSIILLVVGFIFSGDISVVINIKVVVLYIYSALLSAIAFGIWYSLLRNNKASEITIYKFIIPVIGAFLSAIFLPGESITYNIFIGLIFVALGIYLCNKNSYSPKSK